MQTAQLSLNTLLAVLEANDQGDLIKLALLQDLGLNFLEKNVGEKIVVEFYNDRDVLSLLADDEEFEGGKKSYIHVACPIVRANPISLEKTWLVQCPDGTERWIRKNQYEPNRKATRIVKKGTNTVSAD